MACVVMGRVCPFWSIPLALDRWFIPCVPIHRADMNKNHTTLLSIMRGDDMVPIVQDASRYATEHDIVAKISVDPGFVYTIVPDMTDKQLCKIIEQMHIDGAAATRPVFEAMLREEAKLHHLSFPPSTQDIVWTDNPKGCTWCHFARLANVIMFLLCALAILVLLTSCTTPPHDPVLSGYAGKTWIECQHRRC